MGISSSCRRDDHPELDVNGDEEAYFSAFSGDESEEEDEDEILALELQLQEILFSEIRGSSSADDEMIRCGICMEWKDPSQFMAEGELCGRSHGNRFCLRCLDLYVSSKLDQNAAHIGCPEPGCDGGDLDPLRLRFVLPGSTFERWCGVLCRSMIENKFYCPYGDCSAILEGGRGGGGGGGGGGGEGEEEEEEEITMAECPHCNRLFCARCGVTWHEGIGCGEGERGRREELLTRELAARMRWQTCPQCGITVERIDGCRFMRCRCGYCFCYICASPMSQEDHHCYKCGT